MTTEPGLTREELLEVALLDFMADAGPLPTDEVVREAQEWLADHGAWSPDVWPLLEAIPSQVEMEQRVAYLARLGMVLRHKGTVEITRAGYQMWDGFPWEYFAEADDEER